MGGWPRHQVPSEHVCNVDMVATSAHVKAPCSTLRSEWLVEWGASCQMYAAFYDECTGTGYCAGAFLLYHSGLAIFAVGATHSMVLAQLSFRGCKRVAAVVSKHQWLTFGDISSSQHLDRCFSLRRIQNPCSLGRKMGNSTTFLSPCGQK